uniref:Olfactory receptor n=1 Tax=Vombatus ursinus TaxID=29139 RepID=A0A4X2LLA6_VOMUR
MKNMTEFILLGLTQDPVKQKIVFAIFLVFYTATVLENLLIILTIKTSPTLESPMYFFLTYLSFADSCISSTTATKLIVDNHSKKPTISFDECMTQIFAEHFLAGVEVIVLTTMAFDRYVAICKPLHYVTIMNQPLCLLLVGVAWAGGLLHSMIQIFFMLPLPFCGPNVIDHFMCDLYLLLELACTDTHMLGLMVVANSGLICMINFSLLLVSYGIILYSLRTHSSAARRKALSTCVSHITVVVLFFVPCIFEYIRPPTTFSFDKMVAIFYSFLTPLLNPLIYTFRNTEMKNAVKKLWSKTVINVEK